MCGQYASNLTPVLLQKVSPSQTHDVVSCKLNLALLSVRSLNNKTRDLIKERKLDFMLQKRTSVKMKQLLKITDLCIQ